MKKMLTLSVRNLKEMLRDPLTLLFGLGFPLIVLGILTAIQHNIPVSLFEIDSLTPGMTVFGLSFITLFSAMTVSKDRETALLQRLYTTPLTPVDFILGYTLPLLPMALLQTVICYLAGWIMGMKMTVNILWAVLLNIPISLFFIALGLFFGSLLSEKQVGGICGALITNLTAFLSGIWIDVNLAGGFFKTLAEALPFLHGVELARSAAAGNFAAMAPHLLWVTGYMLVFSVLSVFVFIRQMKRQ